MRPVALWPVMAAGALVPIGIAGSWAEEPRGSKRPPSGPGNWPSGGRHPATPVCVTGSDHAGKCWDVCGANIAGRPLLHVPARGICVSPADTGSAIMKGLSWRRHHLGGRVVCSWWNARPGWGAAVCMEAPLCEPLRTANPPTWPACVAPASAETAPPRAGPRAFVPGIATGIATDARSLLGRGCGAAAAVCLPLPLELGLVGVTSAGGAEKHLPPVGLRVVTAPGAVTRA